MTSNVSGPRLVRTVHTTRSDPWTDGATTALAPLTIASMADLPGVMIRTDETRQVVEGFGGCFNELGWRALGRLSESDRAGILDDLFTPGEGLNFSLARTPLGANDFSLDWYSYDETPGDRDLAEFSIDRDRQTLLPFIREALQRNPGLRVWASPWSPPTWLKRNGHYAAALPIPGSGVSNGLSPEQVGAEDTDMFDLSEDNLDTYARYFARYVQEYRAEGVEIAMVMPQNEFNSAQVFPSCTWTGTGLAAFIGVLGPVMAELGVEVFLGTLERAKPEMVEAVMSDPAAAPWVRGVGLQWAGKGAIAEIVRAHPELAVYQTEQECGDGRNDWRFARHTWALLRHFFTNGAGGYLYWNIALDAGGVSHWGWAQNSLVVVDPETGGFSYTHEYYVLRHLAAYVQPGARRLETFSWSGYENQLAFANPDGSVVVVVQNDMSETMPYSLALDGDVLRTTLPADSFTTLLVEPST
jgi:glucosylceramidase